MVNLRPHQKDAIDAIIKEYSKGEYHTRQFIEMPTGSGKTITFLSFASQNKGRTLVVVPSIQLMNQVYETAIIFYEKSLISRKGDNFNQEPKDLHICVANSLNEKYVDRLTDYHFDLIIIDEAHHSFGKSYKRLIDSRQIPTTSIDDAYFLGVTATPERRDGKLLKELLWTCSYKKTISEMIEEGVLCEIEGYRLKSSMDLSNISKSNGDFNINQLYKLLSNDERNNMILKLYNDNLKDRKTLVFCINIKHSKELTKIFNENDIKCLHIDGTMTASERKSILNSFRNGETDVLCNCQLLTEGFDEPSIDGIILARPTLSRALFLQMIGRGLRIYPNKKNCKILDIVDNHKRTKSFNAILGDGNFKELNKFSDFKELKEHYSDQISFEIETNIERTRLIDEPFYENLYATESMIEFLNKNKITFFEPISFNEASFLIFYHKLKEKYYGIDNS